MTNVSFSRISLLSHRDKAALSVPLARRTLVTSDDNDVGKSCLLKSFYWTLGAEIPQVPPPWPSLGVESLLEMQIDDEVIFAYRKGSTFAHFDSSGALLNTYRAVGGKLTEWFAERFDFRLQLTENNSGELGQASPAFLFVPFYIDQDRGWSSPTDSFDRLNQFRRYRDATYEFHTGIKDSPYYLTVAEIASAEEQLEEARDRRSVLGRVRGYTGEIDGFPLALSINDFEQELSRLTSEAESLSKSQRELEAKVRVSLKVSQELKQNLAILRAAKSEAELTTASSELSPEIVVCPTCQAEYSNGFAERFSLALDTIEIDEAIHELEEELAKVTRQLQRDDDNRKELAGKLNSIENRLSTTREAITLQEVIESAGVRVVRSRIDQDISAADTRIGQIDSILENLKTRRRELTDSKKKAAILDRYSSIFSQLLNELDVVQVDENGLRVVGRLPSQSGSDATRVRLAQAVATIISIAAKPEPLLFPFIVDSPNQQDQDKINLETMFEILLREVAPETQLIVGGVSAPLSGKFDLVHSFDRKRQLLDAAEYAATVEMMAPFTDQIRSSS